MAGTLEEQFLEAVETRNGEEVKELLEMGADIHADDDWAYMEAFMHCVANNTFAVLVQYELPENVEAFVSDAEEADIYKDTIQALRDALYRSGVHKSAEYIERLDAVLAGWDAKYTPSDWGMPEGSW